MLKSMLLMIVLTMLWVNSVAQENEGFPVPKRVAAYSAMLPGAGQVVNQKAWKVPIVYTGFGVVGYALYVNISELSRFRPALRAAINGQPHEFEGIYSTDQLRQRKTFYQRNRDLTIISGVIWYTLNIIDAYVDAHLRGFDINDNLSINENPMINDFTFAGAAYYPVFNIGYKIGK